MREPPLCVIGLWHQGVVAAACLADRGHDVLAADRDGERVRRLAAGRAPLFEPGLDELVDKGLREGRLRFTNDLGGAVRGRRDVLLAFDTPVDERDESDLGEIFAVAREVAPVLAPDTILLVTAQVPVGTCDEIARAIRAANPGARFDIAYSPENLRLGQAIDRFLHPALPVIGAADERVFCRVEAVLPAPAGAWMRVPVRTAEMTKHALNAFLALSVCFGNEVGNLCDEVGADGWRVAEALRLEPRVGPQAMLRPGLGFSGGTLARDVQTLRTLGDRFGLDTPLLDGAWDSNRRQNGLVVRKLERALGTLDGVPVAVLGLTYTPGTSTLRRSAALEVIGDLIGRGAGVSAHDPRADRRELAVQPGLKVFDDVYDALAGARAAVLMTAWPEYRELAFDRVRALMARPLILDTASLLDAGALEGQGFTYLDIGRGRGARRGA
jgi:UDPglucose 6-dehydrogenase